MSRAGQIFVAALWVVGLATGIVLARAPHLLAQLPLPAFTIPLAAGLVLELLLRSRSQADGLTPVGSGERGAGVLGGAVIAFAAGALLAPN